jgi:T-complex protein 1 subunit alpha
MYGNDSESQTGLQINGQRISGNEAREQNVSAAVIIANIVKSSLGPHGLDKMLVDDIGEITVTNDGAEILKNLEIEHPAAKVLVRSSNAQDEAVGDGTTSVVILSAELLKKANQLIKNNIHPTSIIAGFKLAAKKAIEYIKSELQMDISQLSKETLLNAAKTSMSSKIIGAEPEFFAKMVVDAMTSIKTTRDGADYYNINSITILKKQGKSAKESELINGFALNCKRASQSMPLSIKGAKIALLDIDLHREKLQLGIQVNITDPDKVEEVQEKEISLIKHRIKLLFDAGANVIMTTKGIDDMCIKYITDHKGFAVRRCTTEDLRKIAKLSGGTLISSFMNLEGEESYESSFLGHAEEVLETRVADEELIYVKGCKSKQACSIVLRGPTDYMLDEMSRSLHDALCVVQKILINKFIVPGGGCVEAALSIYLENFANTIESREQLAIAEFAEAILVIPKTLAVNAALDSTELVAKLRAYHNAAQKNPQEKGSYKRYGLDLNNGKVIDNVEHGVVEPALIKIKYIQFATEAAITILRIDDIIKLNPKPSKHDPHDELMGH